MVTPLRSSAFSAPMCATHRAPPPSKMRNTSCIDSRVAATVTSADRRRKPDITEPETDQGACPAAPPSSGGVASLCRLGELRPIGCLHASHQGIAAAAIGLEDRRLAFANVEPVLAEGVH